MNQWLLACAMALSVEGQFINSSLIIKEPSRGLTFVVLTNSDQLSARYRLGSGDLMSSTVAQVFVNAFVTGSLGKN